MTQKKTIHSINHTPGQNICNVTVKGKLCPKLLVRAVFQMLQRTQPNVAVDFLLGFFGLLCSHIKMQ